jgi:hypothetical protein
MIWNLTTYEEDILLKIKNSEFETYKYKNLNDQKERKRISSALQVLLAKGYIKFNGKFYTD